jgi:molecular chaperone DnaJ
VTKLDYYEVLSVSRTASDGELKTAYRKLAMQYHPDRNPGNAAAEEKFKECSEAYQVLTDADKRAAYDRYGHAGVSGGGPGAGAGSPFANAQDLGDIFGDIFGEMFGGQGARGGRGSRAQRGRDLRYDQTIDFSEAVFGKEVEVSVKRMEVCATCEGLGTRSNKGPATCRQCGGRGQVRFQQGFFSVARTCTAPPATATDALKRCTPSASAFPRALKKVRASATRGAAMPAASVAPPAISISCSRSSLTRSSSATATTCIVSFLYLLRRPRLAMRSRFLRSRATPA